VELETARAIRGAGVEAPDDRAELLVVLEGAEGAPRVGVNGRQ
jgi:hypothetical protein